MRNVVCLIGFLVFLPIGSLAQETDYTEEVKTYLLLNGTAGQYEYAYDGLLKMLQNQYPKTSANEKGWAYLNENKSKSIQEMIGLLVPVYQAHFNASEIQEMIRFYESETGKQLLQDRSQMTSVQKEELNTYYNSVLGKKVIAKQNVLSEEISKVSEHWSRLLYETAVSLLK